MSDEGAICPSINLLVDLFLYLLIFNYMWYVKEDVVQRKKRSTSKRRTMIKMHKCHEKHWRHNLLSLGNAAKFSGEIIQAELTRWRLEKRDFHTEEAEYAKSPNMGQWDTILNFHVKLGKQLSLSLDSSLVTIPKFSNCWFKLLFLGLLYIHFLKTRILKVYPTTWMIWLN